MSLAAVPDSQIPHPWVQLVRVAWVVIALALIASFFVGLPLRYAELSEICAGSACAVLTLAPSEVDMLQNLGLTVSFYAGFQIVLELYMFVVFVGLAILVF